jgi:hypothetical protein
MNENKTITDKFMNDEILLKHCTFDELVTICNELKEEIKKSKTCTKALNLNQSVKVKLTPLGIEKYIQHYNHNLTPKIDEQGYTTLQIHEFMNVFGQYMTIGYQNMLDPLEMHIKAKDMWNIEDWRYEQEKYFRVCDRCGRRIDLSKTYVDKKDTFELCGDCRKAFKKFMENKEIVN